MFFLIPTIFYRLKLRSLTRTLIDSYFLRYIFLNTNHSLLYHIWLLQYFMTSWSFLLDFLLWNLSLWHHGQQVNEHRCSFSMVDKWVFEKLARWWS